jgi:hypothetical protein
VAFEQTLYQGLDFGKMRQNRVAQDGENKNMNPSWKQEMQIDRIGAAAGAAASAIKTCLRI